jgi:ribosomal protein S18 acetylase RimI-like enzyme
MTFHIRRATSADLERLVSFAVAEAKEAEGIEKDSEQVRQGVTTALNDDSIARYWVIEKNNTGVIGSVSIVNEWSDWNSGYYWWIQNMYILPEFRGKGLMEQLIQALKEAARNEGALELRLYVHKNNAQAISAYQKVGFFDADYRIMTMSL